MPKAFPAEMYSSLVCVCDPNATLIREQDDLVCSRCALRNPIVDGVPVIFHPENSVFDATETIERYRASARRPKRNLFATQADACHEHGALGLVDSTSAPDAFAFRGSRNVC